MQLRSLHAGHEILDQKQYLAKKSVWIFGGDGWAYDIGFGGLDHVLASGEDVNVMVFDTEVYSNTGGQASKASQIGQVAQFAAAGKAIGKKSLAEIAMSYGYVYVAQIAMGARPEPDHQGHCRGRELSRPVAHHRLCALRDARREGRHDELPGRDEDALWSVAIGITSASTRAKKAEGKNPFTLDSKAPTADYKEFIESETRYSRLQRAFPERAEALFKQAAANSRDRYAYLTKLAKLYAPDEA